MALKNLSDSPELKKQELLRSFIEAPESQSFPQEVVALYLDCSPWTLAKMRCNDNELPFRKIGRRVSYKKCDVLAYEAKKTVTCTAQLSS
ncbi:helix-turn-helix domain-containing protein [Acinetobacter sp. ME22]|uniref:helix-turn-helix domain-containing protein n=1 Tax=Acinetobacter sp. ME22 TaxID=2904802 RepID=UPI001EDC5664|nr:helix-turn-helix domain-containing protein [Acinetobacter sp. ME22]MCG2572000.1 helix-turn-helix domain-containing protein [Acinetobacter sp. ME22]